MNTEQQNQRVEQIMENLRNNILGRRKGTDVILDCLVLITQKPETFGYPACETVIDCEKEYIDGYHISYEG